MSHLPSFTLSEFLTEDIMFLYGSLNQGDVIFNTQNELLTLDGVNLSYSSVFIQEKIDKLENIITEYKQDENYEEYADTVGMLSDIQTVLKDTLDRLSWLQ